MNTSDGFPPTFTFHLPVNLTDSTILPEHLVYTVVYGINFLLGLPANSYVLWLIVTGAGSGVASEFFALNLSVSDIIYCLSNLLTLFNMYYRFQNYRVAVFFEGFLSFGRPLFQCCICVERYLAVVHPVTFLKYRPLRYRVGCSAVAWLIILGSCLVIIIIPDSRIFYIYLAHYLVYFSVILFCCLAVLRALKQPGPGEGGREREGENQMKRNAFRIILIILVSMVLTYIPAMVTLVLHSFLNTEEFSFARVMCNSILVLTGFVQPLLYLHRAGKLPFIRAP